MSNGIEQSGFCKKTCKGYQETGRCFVDDCKALKMQESLEEETRKWFDERYSKAKRPHKFEDYSGHYLDNETLFELVHYIAEKAIKYKESLHVSETCKEKSNSLTSELEKFAQDFEDYYDTGASSYLNCVRGDIKNAVIAGAKKQQQLMMKGAVDVGYSPNMVLPSERRS